MKDLYSRSEAARVLGVSHTTISNYVKKGLLSEMSACLNGSSRLTYFYPCDEVDTLKEKYPDAPQILANFDDAILTLKKQTEEVNERIEQIRNEILSLTDEKIDRTVLSDCVLSALLAVGSFMGHPADPKYKEIVSDFLHNYSLKKISESRNITVERARIEIYKALRHLMKGSIGYSAENYNLAISENNRLRNENKELKDALRQFSMSSSLNKGENQNSGKINLETNEYIDSHPILMRMLVEFGFSPRAMSCLRKNNIVYVYELVFFSRQAILSFQTLGKKTMSEIEKFVEDNNLTFEAPVLNLISPDKLALKPFNEMEVQIK